MTYIAGLDGLRAVAVILVLLCHARVPGLPGSNIGVDVFLVLSGFLITSLLLDELEKSGSIRFQRFYLRRAWRLMPALLILIFLYAVFSSWLWPNYYFHLRDGLAVLLYITNLAIISGNSPEKLLHGWSLALEEQFYLLWPLMLKMWWNVRIKSSLILILLFLYISIFFWRIICLYWLNIPESQAYYRPDLHSSGLILGGLLAAFLRDNKINGFRCSGFLGLILIAICVVTPQTPEAHLAFFVPIAEIGSLLIILSLLNIDNKIMGSGTMVHIGKLSYGLYLFHYPLMLYGFDRGWGWYLVLFFGGVLSYFMALLSFKYFERPLLIYRNSKFQ